LPAFVGSKPIVLEEKWFQVLVYPDYAQNWLHNLQINTKRKFSSFFSGNLRKEILPSYACVEINFNEVVVYETA
jgi:hypothetical protein